MASGHSGSHSDRTPQATYAKAVPGTRNVAIRPAREFLWVDYLDDQSKGRESLRSRQAFVRIRHHRLQKERQVQQCATTTGLFSTGHCPPKPVTMGAHSSRTHRHRFSKGDHSDEHDDCPVQQTAVLLSSLEAGVLDGGPALAMSTTQNPNIYFHHCAYILHLDVGFPTLIQTVLIFPWCVFLTEHLDRIHSARSCFPLCSNDVTVWFWKKALEDPTLMQIKLSISASHRAAILTASGASTAIVQKPAQDALRLRVGTIKSLQSLLQSAATVYSEQTIFIIAHIITAEALEANSEAAEMHMNGLKRIIAASGGMNILGHGTLAMLYCCEFLRGIMTSSPPMLDMCTKFQSRVLKESAFFKRNDHFTEIPTFGSRFFTTSWSRNLHPMLKSIIFSFQRLVSYYETFDNVHAEPMSVENDSLLYLSYRLLSLPYQCSLTFLQETLRLSILTYSCVRIWNLYGIPCLECLVEMLRKSLLKSLCIIRNTASDLLFWILFIGSLASKGMKSNSWFVAQLNDLAEQLSLKDWNSAKSILEKFFFVYRPSDEPAKGFWDSNFQAGIRKNQGGYIW